MLITPFIASINSNTLEVHDDDNEDEDDNEDDENDDDSELNPIAGELLELVDGELAELDVHELDELLRTT